MTDKEKLVKLLHDGGKYCRTVMCKDCEHFTEVNCKEKVVADHLIANGVTLAPDNNVGGKWIPVGERLPEPFVSVLVQMPGEVPFPTVREGFISNDGIWQSAMYRREPGEVTHWMPMPEPPKGE